MKKKLFKGTLCTLLTCIVALFLSVPTYALDLNYSGGSVYNNIGVNNNTCGFEISVIDSTVEYTQACALAILVVNKQY